MQAYLSHYIRGAKGTAATDADMDANRDRASLVGAQLRILVPELDIYVPADNDAFVHYGYRAGILTEKIILDVDCHIIDCSDLCLFHDPENCMMQSRGMVRELNHTKDTNTPYLIFQNVTPLTVEEIKALVLDVKLTPNR